MQARVLRAYGSFAGVMILLVWLWLTNFALLFGAEPQRRRDRTRENSPT
jgi:membrane protein